MKGVFKKLFKREISDVISDTREVPNINKGSRGDCLYPHIETKVLETSKGKIVVRKEEHRLESGMLVQMRKYGFLIKEILWGESEAGKRDIPDSSNYNVPFEPNLPVVYIVKREITEEGKRALAKTLREEDIDYGVINFF